MALRINPKKCTFGICGSKANTAPATLDFLGVALTPASTLDVLGVTIVTIHCARTPFVVEQRTRKRHDEAAKRLTILKHTRLSWVAKSRAVASMIGPS